MYAAGAFRPVLERVQRTIRGIDGTRATLVAAAQALRNVTAAMQVAVEHGRKDSVGPEQMMGARPNAARAGRAAERQERQAAERMRHMRMAPVGAPERGEPVARAVALAQLRGRLPGVARPGSARSPQRPARLVRLLVLEQH